MSLSYSYIRILSIIIFICLFISSQAQTDSSLAKIKSFPIAIELQGKLIDKQTGKILSGTVELTAPGIASCKILNDPKTGIYSVKLKRNVRYSYKAFSEGYFTTKGEISISDPIERFIVNKDIYFLPIETETPIVIPNILFIQSKAEFSTGTTSELDKLVQLMEDNPSLEIELSGHTDSQGNEEKNLQLSNERAGAVKNYLVSKGINGERITSKGYGSSNPLASNKSEETRQQNRRVEYKILKF